MHSTIAHTRFAQPNFADYAWTLPVFIVVLMVAGAIASLVTGFITPDVIGADGLTSSFMLRGALIVSEGRRATSLRGDELRVHARSVLQSPALTEGGRRSLAIGRAPTQYVQSWCMPDGTRVMVRPIRPDDEPLMRDFYATLSEQTVYLRYLHMVQRSQPVAHEALSHLCFVDFDQVIALVVEGRDSANEGPVILGVGRLSRMARSGEAEFDLLVHDVYQRHGLGTALLRRLIEVGRAEGLRRITATMLCGNHAMQRTCQKLGFQLKYVPEDQAMVANLAL